ncbi:antibiotic biosynthesis monooxygenase [Rhodococcus sp. NPDC058514]|uniref:antibiotic biosynthesis monooxygenase n=1 Tax=unclassified Rhodococcus (in: high G+C Gram-positive bacteria) TaxID=192944 RepID=UPI00364EB881
MSAATAVTVFHRTPDGGAFAGWADGVGAAAGGVDGFVDARVAAYRAPELDWAVSVTFDSEEHLHRWLDSAERDRLIAAGERLGFRRASSDLILLEGDLPPGVAVFEHTVAPGRERAFEEAQVRLSALISTFSGFEGTTVLRPREPGRWMSVLRFRTDRQLSEWMRSDQRTEALPELRSQLLEDFSVVARSTPFGSILRLQDGKARITPRWRTAMLVLLVLYPTVMTLSRFLGPVLSAHGVPPWLSMWLSQIVSVALLTWLFMPAATRWFRRWLDPVDGAGVRVGLIGAGAVVVVYAATLSVFASVHWLQFWDYMD